MELAKRLNLRGHDCSLFCYNDVRASIQETLGSNLGSDEDCEILDELARHILLEVASVDFYIDGETKPRSVVLDSLSLRSDVDRALRLWMHVPLAAAPLFVVVECGPFDYSEDYCVDGILQVAVDPTDPAKSDPDHAKDVIDRIMLYARRLKEADSGPECKFLPHESCAELPYKIKFGGKEFLLGPSGSISNEHDVPRECIVCYGSSGVLYSFGEYPPRHVHPKCAELPPKLKHSCHEHDLKLKVITFAYICFGCGSYGHFIGSYGHFIGYGCKDCRVYFHVTCTLHLEKSVRHGLHRHPFRLCTIPRDETNEYYCEICTGERHPDLWAYHCEPCGYEAHLSCVNARVRPCDPIVLLPQFRRIGMLRLLKPWPSDVFEKRHPMLGETSRSQLAWTPVNDGKEGSDSGSDPDVPRHS